MKERKGYKQKKEKKRQCVKLEVSKRGKSKKSKDSSSSRII